MAERERKASEELERKLREERERKIREEKERKERTLEVSNTHCLHQFDEILMLALSGCLVAKRDQSIS